MLFLSFSYFLTNSFLELLKDDLCSILFGVFSYVHRTLPILKSLNYKLASFPRTRSLADTELGGVGYLNIKIIDVSNIFIDGYDLIVNFLSLL